MYPCWNRILRRRGEWMIRSWISSSRLATMTRSMRLMAFGTARSMPKSQQQVSCQGSTIWSRGRATLRRRIPGSLHRRSSTFEGSSPPTTKTIQKSRQRHLTPSIQLRWWLGHPLYPSQQPSPRRLQNKADLLSPRRLQQRNAVNLLGLLPLPPSERRSPRPLFCLIHPLVFFLKKYSTCRLGGFSPITLHEFFGFPPPYYHWIRRFFHQLILYLPHRIPQG